MNNNTVKRCDFRIHDIIDGKYRVERVLSSTQTYQQFKVIDSSGKEYILKLLKLWEVEPRLRSNMIVSAENEIKSCNIKSHYLTNIVQTGIVNGNPYLLTEYFKSLDLTHYLRNPRLNVVKVVKDILYGLRDLHKSGKVHCQIMPENILITDAGRTMITNYVVLGGRGNLLSAKNKTSNSRYIDKSLAYQAPELYNLDRYVTLLPTIDVYSFGVVLFQLLTGELPFGRLVTESDWINYQSRARSNDWNRNILLRNDLRDVWISVLDMCLTSDANSRAKNIDEILDILPKDDNHYGSVTGSNVEAPKNILNGIMLHVMQGDEFGKCYRLPELLQHPKRIITVGRRDDSVFNVIQIPELISSFISRRHCTIEFDYDNDVWYIRDGQWDKETKKQWTPSLNGTFVNSEEVTEEGHKIVPGDIISIGDVKLRIEAY